VLQKEFWDRKWFQIKSHQLHRRDLQLRYKVYFHPTLFEKVMNFIMLHHGYHRRIIQRAGSGKTSSPLVHMARRQ
jgi:hypothetical protein